jgi:hypothetical protein
MVVNKVPAKARRCGDFGSVTVISFDLVEGDLSISQIETHRLARRRITMSSEERWRAHYVSRLLRCEILAPTVTMVVNGRSI